MSIRDYIRKRTNLVAVPWIISIVAYLALGAGKPQRDRYWLVGGIVLLGVLVAASVLGTYLIRCPMCQKRLGSAAMLALPGKHNAATFQTHYCPHCSVAFDSDMPKR